MNPLLPTVDYQDPEAPQKFVESLRATGFGVLSNHPIPQQAVNGIYSHWLEFFNSGTKDQFAFNPDRYDGFFAAAEAEAAKGRTVRDIKEYYHYYPWGQCPDELREEIVDRFGPLPEPAARLMRLCQLKLEAAVWQVTAIYLQDKYLTFKFQDRRRFEQLAAGRKVLRIIDEQTALVTLKSAKIDPDKMLSLVKSLLQPET